MLSKLLMIFMAATAGCPAIAAIAATQGASGIPVVGAECDCQRYGYCPAPPAESGPRPPPPPRPSR